MTQSLIRGSTQILDASIPAAKLAGNIPDSALTNGANYIKKDGSVAMTAALNAGGFVINGVASPVAGTDAANKSYVDGLVNGIALRRARLLSNANVTLSGAQTIDGVSAVAGDRVLLTAQTTASQNGLWVVAAGAWTRPTDWAAASTQKSTMFLIEEGTVFHDTKHIAVTDGITVDTTSVTITQDSSGTSYTAGQGLTLTGNQFKITDSGSNGQVMIGNASNAATFTTLSGDIASITGAGVVTLAATVAKKADFINNETPSGAVNGSNTAFNLANTPAAGTLMLFLNGQLLEVGAGNDYTLSAAAITMLFTPQTGDKLRATYFK